MNPEAEKIPTNIIDKIGVTSGVVFLLYGLYNFVRTP